VSASWLRQCFYSTARFGLNSYFVEKAKQRTGQQKLSAYWEIACAGASGGLAGMIGNPTEVLASFPSLLESIKLTPPDCACQNVR